MSAVRSAALSPEERTALRDLAERIGFRMLAADAKVSRLTVWRAARGDAMTLKSLRAIRSLLPTRPTAGGTP